MTRQKNIKRNAISGFSLTETIIVLGVIGMIIGAIWGGVAVIYKKKLINETADNIVILANNVRLLYADGADFKNGLTDIRPTIINAKAAPESMIDGNTLKTPWGTNVGIRSITYNIFEIQLDNSPAGQLPKDACVQIVTKLTGKARSHGIIRALMNGMPINVENNAITYGSCSSAAITFSLR